MSDIGAKWSIREWVMLVGLFITLSGFVWSGALLKSTVDNSSENIRLLRSETYRLSEAVIDLRLALRQNETFAFRLSEVERRLNLITGRR